jgi:hypothetical protein
VRRYFIIVETMDSGEFVVKDFMELRADKASGCAVDKRH